MTKQEIRKKIKCRVREHECELKELSLSLCRRIEESQYLEWADTVLIYLALEDEVDMTPILDRCISNDKKVFVPKVDLNTMTMDFYEYKVGGTVCGSYGIMEPTAEGAKLDSISAEGKRILVLTPGRAFTKDGSRLGRGKGFYDRYLELMEGWPCDILVAGVCFPFQIVPEIPCDEHDRKMDVLFV